MLDKLVKAKKSYISFTTIGAKEAWMLQELKLLLKNLIKALINIFKRADECLGLHYNGNHPFKFEKTCFNLRLRPRVFIRSN